MREAKLEPYIVMDGARAIASEHGAGPWDPSMLHGGVPAALVARLVDDLPTAVPMRVTRLTIDLMRPVPAGVLDFAVEVTREGRNIQTSEVVLSAKGKPVVRATGLKVRDKGLEPPAGKAPAGVSGVPAVGGIDRFRHAGFNRTVEMREAAAADRGTANAAVWARIERPFFGDCETSPLMRAAATGDYCNGFGSGLDFEQWTYINADLSLHFARAPVGEWMMLAADAMIGPEGRAVAFGALADAQGYFGRATQSLVLDRR